MGIFVVDVVVVVGVGVVVITGTVDGEVIDGRASERFCGLCLEPPFLNFFFFLKKKEKKGGLCVSFLFFVT